jgi:hypothetical protein
MDYVAGLAGVAARETLSSQDVTVIPYLTKLHRHLFHDDDPGDDVLLACQTVDEWYAEVSQIPGCRWSYAHGLVWAATHSNLLRVSAMDTSVTVTVAAPPDHTVTKRAGTFVREPDGRYRWEPEDEGVVTSDRVGIIWKPATGKKYDAVAYGVVRPVRDIVTAGISTANGAIAPVIIWNDPSLARIYVHRIKPLLEIDERIFGGLLADADSRGLGMLNAAARLLGAGERTDAEERAHLR